LGIGACETIYQPMLITCFVVNLRRRADLLVVIQLLRGPGGGGSGDWGSEARDNCRAGQRKNKSINTHNCPMDARRRLSLKGGGFG
jgi:hypothetical protein